MASARDILVNLLGKETISPAAKKAAGAVEDLGDELRDTSRDAKKLDDEIEDLNRSLLANAAAWRAAGSEAERVDFAKAMRVDQAKLRQHLNVRKLLQGAGEDGASGFFAGFSGRIGPLMARAPLSPPVIAALAAGAPAMSSVIAGAVTAGVAVGVVGAGAALAASNPQVQAGAKSLGEQISRGLKVGASSFVPEVVKSIDLIGDKFTELQPQIRSIFDTGSSRVVPLTHSFTRALDELIPALEQANAKADPLMETLNEHIPDVAAAAGDALRKFSEDTQNSADALDTLLTAAEAAVGGTATIVGWLNKIGPAVAGPLYALGEVSEDTGDKIDSATGKTAGWDASFRAFAGSTGVATSAVRSFSDAIDDWTGRNLSAENASLRLEAAIDAATAAGKKNNDGIDRGTEKGRANRELLIQLADAAKANAQAIYEQTGSMEKANAATAAARAQFIAAARAMGVGAAEAERLAGMLFAIPSPNPKVTLDTAKAMERAKAMREVLAGIRSKNVKIGIYFETHGRNTGDLKVPGGYHTKDRWGGMHVPMAAGGIMSAGIYPASNPPLIQFAEPATGGEAYIPRKGNAARSKQILGKAADWYDMDVVPRGGRPSAGRGIDMHEFARLNARELARALSGAVFRIDDRTARLVDLYARGG